MARVDSIDLNAIAVRIHKDDLEKDIVKDGLLRLRQLIADQGGFFFAFWVGTFCNEAP